MEKVIIISTVIFFVLMYIIFAYALLTQFDMGQPVKIAPMFVKFGILTAIIDLALIIVLTVIHFCNK